MRILLINKYLYPAGGTETYVLNLSKLLQAHGHQVAYFAMHHPRNQNTPWQKYLVSRVDLRKPSRFGRLKTLSRLFYSPEARRQISHLLDDFQPDIAHFHNIYGHLSPSILPEIKKRHIPLLHTVHDYHLIHPNVVMYHHQQICEVTKNHTPLNCIPHHCLDDSLIYSTPPVLAFWLHQKFGFYSRYTDHYLVPSLFMHQKLIEFGFDPLKVTYLPHPVNPPPSNKNTPTKPPYVLYFGRLTHHKGVHLIPELASRLPHIPFKIIGRGPLKGQLAHQIHHLNLKNLHLEPSQSGSQLQISINQSAFTLLPSLWYENQSYSVLESFAHGKPVIASNIGGLPELITPHQTGLLTSPGDLKQLSSAIQKLWTNSSHISKMGTHAQQFVRKHHHPATHYQNLLSIYQTLLH